MEGRPWLRILLILIGFTLLGFPVWSSTRPGEVVIPTKEKVAAAEQPLHVQVSFAEPPASFDLEYLGSILCKGAAPQRDFSCDWKVGVPKEGVDLFVSASWPEGSPKTAVRVKVFRDGNPLADETFWTEGSLAETVTVNERQP
jgi:hypothetical protein